MNNNVINQIRECFQKELRNDLSELSNQEQLKDVAMIDSLVLFKIMVELENRFKIKFDIDSLEEVFHTIDTIAEYIIKHKQNDTA